MSLRAREKPLTDAAEPVTWARPLSRETLTNGAYAALRAALMEGLLRPGEALKLRPVSARFGISVTPMREALLRLVAERALRLDARGTVVVPALTRGEVREIALIRGDLEGRAAATLAEGASPAAIGELEARTRAAETRMADGDIPEAVRENTRFHIALCRAAGLPILTEMVEALWVRTGPMLWSREDDRFHAWTPDPHLDLIQALRDRDPAAAEAAMRADVARWARRYVAHAEPDPDPSPDRKPDS